MLQDQVLTSRRTLHQSRSEPAVIALETLLEVFVEELKNKLLTCYDEKAFTRLQGQAEGYKRILDAVQNKDLKVDNI